MPADMAIDRVQLDRIVFVIVEQVRRPRVCETVPAALTSRSRANHPGAVRRLLRIGNLVWVNRHATGCLHSRL